MDNLFSIHVDNRVFRLTRRTIQLYPDGLLARAINTPNFADHYVIVNGNDIYVDRDPESFKYVIDKLRNYDLGFDLITDEILKKKIIDDLDYFDLYCNYNKLDDVETHDPTMVKQFWERLENDDVENPMEIIQNISSDPSVLELAKEQNKVNDESSSDSLELSDEDYEMI
jgi:hypothetical protein